MVPPSNLLSFALAAVILIAVPGPSVLFVIGRSLALGWRGGVLTVLGNAAGQLVQVAAVALGAGIVVAQSVVLFTVVKFAGAAYPIYLGIKAICHRRDHRSPGHPPVKSPPRRLVTEGLVVGVTNPKSVVFSWLYCRSSWTTLPAPSRSNWRSLAQSPGCPAARPGNHDFGNAAGTAVAATPLQASSQRRRLNGLPLPAKWQGVQSACAGHRS